MSIEYNIKDVSSVENEKFDYDDILNLVDVSIRRVLVDVMHKK